MRGHHDTTTSLIAHRNHVPHAFDLFCRMRKNQHHRHPQYSFLACSAPGHTHPRAFSFAPLLMLMLMPISRCCHASLSLYFSCSLSARLTGVHLSCDPTVRIRSIDVRLIRSPATLPRAMHTQLTQVICVDICTLTAYICVTEASAPETRRSESVSRHGLYGLAHRAHDLRYFYPVS